MNTMLYRIIQCTWGGIQTLLGSILFLLHRKDGHFSYHGAIVTQWRAKSSVSIGMFVFITDEPCFYEKLRDEYSMEELCID